MSKSVENFYQEFIWDEPIIAGKRDLERFPEMTVRSFFHALGVKANYMKVAESKPGISAALAIVDSPRVGDGSSGSICGEQLHIVGIWAWI